MKLSSKEKKFIKHNKKNLSAEQIAVELKAPVEDVLEYLKKQLSDDKFEKYRLVNSKNTNATASPFSFKNFFKTNIQAIIILITLLVISYANSINNDFVSDDHGITAIKNLGSLQALFTSPSHFMVGVFYTIAFKLGGYTPLFYRLSNIIFHLGTVIALLILFTLLTNNVLAFIVAALFAVHPILIESVGWISGIQYVQYGFFCVCALLASEKAIIFPFLFFLYEISFGNIKKNWKYVVPFFLIIIVPALYYVSQISVRLNSLGGVLINQPKVTFNPFFQIPVAISSYLQLIFWPGQLTLYHSEMSFSTFEFSIRVLVVIGYFLFMGYQFFKNKQLFFWLSFFVLTLIPTMTPFGISWIVAERYVYLGTVGIIFFVGYVLMRLIENRKTKYIGYIIFVGILIALTARTIVRNIDWQNEDNLWVATGKTSPSDPKTHINLGDMYSRQGNFNQSIAEFKKAIALKPDYADAFHDLANTYIQVNNIPAALDSYQQAIRYNPSLWQSYQNMAVIYYKNKQFALAAQALQKAVEANKENPKLPADLGVVYLEMGKLEEAKHAFQDTLTLDPNNAEAKNGLMKINK